MTAAVAGGAEGGTETETWEGQGGGLGSSSPPVSLSVCVQLRSCPWLCPRCAPQWQILGGSALEPHKQVTVFRRASEPPGVWSGGGLPRLPRQEAGAK